MDGLLDAQAQLGEEIQNSYRNFKKDSIRRKTREYIANRLEFLEEKWEQFQDNHLQLADFEPSCADNEYFTRNYFSTIEQLHSQYKQQLLEGLEDDAITTDQASPSQAVPPKASAKHQAENGPSKQAQPKIRIQEPVSPASSEHHQSEVHRKIRRQKRVMGILTRTLNDIATKSSSTQSRVYYEFNIQVINKTFDAITDLDQQIWEEVVDAPLDYTQEIYDSLHDWVQETLVHLHEKLEGKEINTPSGMAPQIKLPHVTLPIFDGNYTKWTQFHDLFEQMIDSKPISKTEKMFYLTTNLTGEAKALLNHLPISDANYTAAWETLNKRYNNQRLLCTALLNKLWDQPGTQSQSANSVKQLHDVTNECILALENIKVSTTNWDPILIHLLLKKLDKNTHALFEASLDSPRNTPTIRDLLNFLEKRFQTLEALGKESSAHTSVQDQGSSRKRTSYPRSSLVSTNKLVQCRVCKNKNHPLYACQDFLAQPPLRRRQTVKQLNLCPNCLKDGHKAAECTLRSCRKCSERHNSLLHVDDASKSVHDKQGNFKQPQPSTLINDTAAPNPTALTTNVKGSMHNYVMLSTVAVEVSNGQGQRVRCRAVLDSGSQVNFITEDLARRLRALLVPDTMYVRGIGKERQKISHRVNIQLHSTVNNYSTRLEAFVLRDIVTRQPDHKIERTTWPIPKNVHLADPDFDVPGTIDMLIGAEIYFDLMSVGQIKLGEGLPTLQNTVFGWTISGPVRHERTSDAVCGICSEDEKLENQLSKFWRLEEVESSDEGSTLTRVEQRCVDHFNQHVKRDEQGRFMVKLPFAQDPNSLGESRDIALQRFHSLERRLLRNPTLQQQYINFMREYEALGHMKEIDISSIKGSHYFLPHHCVTKLDSSTTKLRVVFDASAKTASNLSLNDVLCKGPTIQNELLSILIRFRFPRFVFTADIEKMYRQVRIAEEDQQYQLIAWREHPLQPVKYFKLCTVTYGLTPAPFLATKCLDQLATEGALTHPLAAQVLRRDFYVDDVMSGSDSLAELLEIQNQLKDLLSSAGFNLRKWCGNHPQLLKNIPRQDIELEVNFDKPTDESIKTLGLTWQPSTDTFQIKTNWNDTRRITKRTALSDISHIFDPLGFMNPVTIIAKIFIRKIWTLKLDWDAALPMDLHTSWSRFREELRVLNDIRIPRHIASGKVYKTMQFHAFADASETAYGAAIYVRTTHQDGIITVRLLCAKSKVAPVKTTTLPRLELCASKLAAQLMQRVRKEVNLPNVKVHYWTDSEIALAWIRSESSSYHTFVANRVAAIQRLSNPEQWRHVGSKDNPADIVSRGMTPAKLMKCNLWFYGPQYLHGPETIWPVQPPITNTDVERKAQRTVALTSTNQCSWIGDINHGNSYQRLLRIVAYVLRFARRPTQQESEKRKTQQLTVNELEKARRVVISQIQQDGFKDELHQLRRHKCVNINSPLNSLCPFLDEQDIIRVGGRLSNAELPYDAKHPMLLPYSHPLTTILMTDIHLRNLHVGPQGLLAITRQRYWPIKGKNIARAIVQHCVRCNKVKPKLMTQLMGNLPTMRVQPARPFVNAGVDFCGPIQTHFKLRGKRPQKSYIAVYCCFATKAIHLEVASDLTTEAFIGTLKRFIARRGNCRNLHCDNATNFVGAKSQLLELQDSIHAPASHKKIVSFCQTKGIDFHFIPPRAPHFGGLWEAAVKSAKSLLRRSVASAELTFEELSTVTAEIEAILNSRPITPLSADPNDLTALTPGHFLIGEPLTAIVDPNAVPQNISCIRRWKMVTHIKHEFWRRWSHEYLCELQQRHKWRQQGQNAKPGMMVLIKEDNLPPLKWQLGRIERTIQGDDGLVRVADVKTTSGTMRRPIHKLAPLPIEAEEDCTTEESLEPLRSSTNMNPAIANETQHRNKRMRPSTSLAASTFLLTCLILPILGQSAIEVTPFTTQSGIYFENLGAANLIRNEWSLIVYYNMEGYWKEAAAINASIGKLRKLCNLRTDTDHCSIVSNQFALISQELTSNNELLQPISAKRLKRAPLNIVGNIAGALFGVLDSEYAERLSVTIDNIHTNENHLLDLIKNQTSLIDSTLNVLKNDRKATEMQLEAINKNIRLIDDQVNKISDELYQQKVAEAFSTLAVQLTLMTMNYQRAQTAITNVLIDTHHGKVNPQLLSPKQVRDELSTIKDYLPSTLRLPARPDNLLQLYSLMKIQGRATSKYIIFQVRLPLFAFEQFELYHIIPVPVIINGTFMAIKPSAEFLVINLHKDKYYPLNKQEFALCETIGESDHMCTQQHPIYRRGANISSCELNLLTYHEPTSSCEIINAEELPKWIQLYNPNKWIYSVSKATVVTIICGDATIQQGLQGTGILSMGGNCEIRHDHLTVQSHNVYPKSMKSSFNPTQNLTDFLYLKGQGLVPKLNASITHHHFEEITSLKQQVQDLKRNEVLPHEANSSSTHQIALGYTALVIAVLTASTMLCINWFRKRQRSRSIRPIPAPRSSLGSRFVIDPELINCPESGQGGGRC